MESFLGWFIGLVVPAARDFCTALAALVGQVQTISFLPVYYFNPFVLIAQQAGQAAVLVRLYLSVCLWSNFTGPFFDRNSFTSMFLHLN
jgi:hypothetical protein